MKCPYCGVEMRRPRQRVRQLKSYRPPENCPTNDHILPKARGGQDVAENYRRVCLSCNRMRGAVGHCIGALACVRAVAGARNMNQLAVIRLWKLPTAEGRAGPSFAEGY